MTEKNSVTPLMKQYYRIKRDHLDKILLFRMGDFYEMFEDDAVVAADALNITLTSRNSGKAGRVPLAGFPHHASQNYIAKLIRKGFRVAVCEQVEDPAKAKGVVKREVIEIITPGTVIDSELLDAKTENHLAAIVIQGGRAGYARMDLSTGNFVTGSFPVDRLAAELERKPPSEIVIQEGAADEFKARWVDSLELNIVIASIGAAAFDWELSRERILDHFGVSSLEGYGCESDPLAISSAGAILDYVGSNLKGNLLHVTSLATFNPDEFMYLDPATQRNLELMISMTGARAEGTLFSVIDTTKTSMGGRLLRHWLLHPLLDKGEINCRLDTVESLYQDQLTRDECRLILGNFCDLERITGRLGASKARPREITSLLETLKLVPELEDAVSGIEDPYIQQIRTGLAVPEEVVERLSAALVENPPATLKDGGVIRSGYDPELDQIRDGASHGKKWIAGLQGAERERTGIPSLKVGYNRVFGYYLEVTKTHLNSVPDNYIRKQTLTNAERYFTPELKEYEVKVLGAEEKAQEREEILFRELCTWLGSYIETFKRISSSIAQLDVLGSFAENAAELGYARPKICDADILKISEGRHPVLESVLVDEVFVPNDLELDQEKRFGLLTGPNMSGKSTYLRQIGLIVLLAQTGSFVPAASAEVGIIDRIFTRVGSSDNIMRGQSTFLSEMIEMANILNNATSRSLLLLDEIGRGTSTFDGLSLAWSITEYLLSREPLTPLSLFATHYHELTTLASRHDSILNMNVSAKEWGDEVIFLRKVEPGSADRSYGIQVARLAGIPPVVLQRAKEILADLEKESFIHREIIGAGNGIHQMDLFSANEDHPVIDELKILDPNNCTPLDALTLIHRWKEQISEWS